MPGRSDPSSPLLDRAARGAADGLSRRDVLRIGVGAALAATLPKVAWPTVGEAAKTRGTCPTVPQGTCPNGLVPGAWRPDATVNVPSGIASTFNGCGPEAGVRIPVIGTKVDPVPDRPLGIISFFDACKAHDCCYGTCGSSQKDCDIAMFRDAVSACFKKYGTGPSALADGRRVHCIELARVYYRAIASMGEEAWAAAQRSACHSCEPCDADLLNDPQNCGTCGNACHPGFICCNGECRDPEVDPNHCGGCGNVCGPGHRCIGGRCIRNARCEPGYEPCGEYDCCPPDRPCMDGECAKQCAPPTGPLCSRRQECCWTRIGDDSSVICCPKGQIAYYNTLAGTGKCITP